VANKIVAFYEKSSALKYVTNRNMIVIIMKSVRKTAEGAERLWLRR